VYKTSSALKILVLAFTWILFLVPGPKAEAAVWTDVNQWSAEWENKFSEWVRSSWQIDFFSRPFLPHGQKNPYYGLRLDCADTVYSMRIIFAFENKLPFVIQDPTASGKSLSNKMSRWDSQNEIARIRHFLEFMFETVSTRSLPNDTYPTALTRDTIRPGSLIMTVAKNHHSWSVKEILPIGVPYLVFNSTVAANSGAELQQRQSWPNPAWVFEGNQNAMGNAGFRYWRPASFINKPVWTVPGYSEEQYHVPLAKWVHQIQAKLALRQETDLQMMTRMLNTTCENLKGRVVAVSEALDYLHKNSRCMDFETFDTYSTPNRDQRSIDDFLALRNAYHEIMTGNGGEQLPSALRNQLNKIYPSIQTSVTLETNHMGASKITEDSYCSTQYLKGKNMDAAEFKRRLFAKLTSPNPNNDGAYRWGDARGPSPHAKSCPAWD
jgi:hypothetical protein